MPDDATESDNFFEPSSLDRRPGSARFIFNLIMTVLAALCTILAIIPLVAVLFYVLFQGGQRIDIALLTQLPPPPLAEGGGLGNALLGTLIIVGIATLISVPCGILAAVYLSEYALGSQLTQTIQFATNVLSGVPSIIAGVFVYGLLVVTGLTGYSAVAGGTALSILMIPTIIRTTDEALQLVPQDVRFAAFGVGATPSQCIIKIVLPAALPSIITGIVLAIARASGETAPLIFTALNSSFWPSGLFQPIASLSVSVYNFALVPFENQQELAWAGSLILVLLVVITSIVARLVTLQKN
ncbi:MAG: phosphate ABC transporter permease PstA [Cyanothece sp. SIO2G6]|nr:phosphate ABC transporter permease PstA [Cyanothece sp. SIO2G6]